MGTKRLSKIEKCLLTQGQIKVAELFVLLNWLQVPLSYFLIDLTPTCSKESMGAKEEN